NSHFAVAALVEVQLDENAYVYVGGVNVENREHNRLGLHAEQNAIAAALTLFGEPCLFTNIWIMGAPDNVETNSDSPLANNFVMPCGHCRQILMSFLSADANVFSITLNGEISEPFQLDYLLPKAFSERDLGDLTNSYQAKQNTIDFSALLSDPSHKDQEKIFQYLNSIQSHIIHVDFKTSGTTACLIKLNSGYYIPGALIQDIAFLTTDAVFASIGLAITSFGKDIQIEAIYLLGNPSELTSSEIQLIYRLSNPDIFVHLFSKDGVCKVLKLSEYINNLNSVMVGTRALNVS
ncbi:MAG: cytidine deaminase, partial [Gammaproteobacteria bacterium]